MRVYHGSFIELVEIPAFVSVLTNKLPSKLLVKMLIKAEKFTKFIPQNP